MLNISLWPLVRRHVIAVLALLVGMVAVWGALWTLAATQYHRAIERAFDRAREEGADITTASRRTSGFPYALVVTFTDFRGNDAKRGARLEIPEVVFTATPWDWHAFDVTFSKSLTAFLPFPTPETGVDLHTNSGAGHIELGETGAWDVLRLHLDHAQVQRATNPFIDVGTLDLSATRPDHPPKDHREVGLTLSLDAQDTTLTLESLPPFGNTITRLDLQWRVMGAPPNPFDRKAVAAWNKESGVIEWDRLNLMWGPLTLEAKGTLGLDDDLQPEGAFMGQVGGYVAVFDALQAEGIIAKRQAGMLTAALSLFAKTSPQTGKLGIELPMTVQLGGVFLGPVKVLDLPEIAWPGK